MTELLSNMRFRTFLFIYDYNMNFTLNLDKCFLARLTTGHNFVMGGCTLAAWRQSQTQSLSLEVVSDDLLIFLSIIDSSGFIKSMANSKKLHFKNTFWDQNSRFPSLNRYSKYRIPPIFNELEQTVTVTVHWQILYLKYSSMEIQ